MFVRHRILSRLLLAFFALGFLPALIHAQQNNSKEAMLTLASEVGRSGGRLVVSLRGSQKPSIR